MRKDEIQVGKVYTNGKGGKRRLIRVRNYIGFEDEAVFAYLSGTRPAREIHTGPDACYFVVGLRSFVRWAKSEVKEGK